MKSEIVDLCDAVSEAAVSSAFDCRVSKPCVYRLVHVLAERWSAPDEFAYVLVLAGLEPANYNLQCDPRAAWARIVFDAFARGKLAELLGAVRTEWYLPARIYPRL